MQILTPAAAGSRLPVTFDPPRRRREDNKLPVNCPEDIELSSLERYAVLPQADRVTCGDSGAGFGGGATGTVRLTVIGGEDYLSTLVSGISGISGVSRVSFIGGWALFSSRVGFELCCMQRVNDY